MTDQPYSPDDFLNALRQLANKWALAARDLARDSKANAESNPTLAAQQRGTAEAYHRLAVELADVVKRGISLPDVPGAPNPTTTGGRRSVSSVGVSASAAAAASASAATSGGKQYADMPMDDVLLMLDYAGTPARDVNRHPDGAFTAIFSRWQPLSEIERLDKIRQADPRLIILDKGKLPDTGDPYVDFAFKPD